MSEPPTLPSKARVTLSPDHLAAIERRRRIVVHFDGDHGRRRQLPRQGDQ